MRKIQNSKFKIQNSSKGFTLIELLVSMGIFLTVITLAVGSVVSTQRFQTRANLERQLQQLGRDVMEKISLEVKNANGWVNADGTMRPDEPVGVTDWNPPSFTSCRTLIIRRHKDTTNYLIIFRVVTVAGNNKLQIAFKNATGGDVPPSVTDADFQDLIGPVGPTTYKLTSASVFSIAPTNSFASDSIQQPRVNILLLLQATFGPTTVNMTLSAFVTSRFYNFKYAY